MCGIAGLIAPRATQEWKAKILDRLLLESQKRGTDATGIAFVDSETKKMTVVKEGTAAKDFVYNNKEYLQQRLKTSNIVLAHCRAATGKLADTGASNNVNNHPFFAPEAGIALIHNGVLQDDERWRNTIGRTNGLRNKPDSLVDSEVMLRVIETFYLESNSKYPTMEDSINDACFNVAGSYCLGIIKEDMPNKLWLVRHSNPLALAWLPDQKAIIFASTEEIIKEAISSWKYHLSFFVEDVSPYAVINNANENSMLSIEIAEDQKNPFKIEQAMLECATTEYKHHRQVHTPASATEVEVGAQ